jgi:two-component system KDP operon response regulator KdpE
MRGIAHLRLSLLQLLLRLVACRGGSGDGGLRVLGLLLQLLQPLLRDVSLLHDLLELTHSALLNGQPMKLTPKEFDLLSFLVRYAGRVITHQQILTTVWGAGHADDAQYLRVLIRRLREKIEGDPGDPQIILAEAGIGYRLVEPNDGG